MRLPRDKSGRGSGDGGGGGDGETAGRGVSARRGESYESGLGGKEFWKRGRRHDVKVGRETMEIEINKQRASHANMTGSATSTSADASAGNPGDE